MLKECQNGARLTINVTHMQRIIYCFIEMKKKKKKSRLQLILVFEIAR